MYKARVGGMHSVQSTGGRGPGHIMRGVTFLASSSTVNTISASPLLPLQLECKMFFARWGLCSEPWHCAGDFRSKACTRRLEWCWRTLQFSAVKIRVRKVNLSPLNLLSATQIMRLIHEGLLKRLMPISSRVSRYFDDYCLIAIFQGRERKG